MHVLLKPERTISSNFHAEIAVGFDYDLRKKYYKIQVLTRTIMKFKKETDK